MLYSIGEISKELNIPTSTIRYYDKEGLLPKIGRSSSGIRIFSECDISWLKLIECLKKTGMSIKDIKMFATYSTNDDEFIEERLEILKNQRKKVLEQFSEMEKMLNTLNYKCWYYEVAKEAGSCSIHNSDNPPTQSQFTKV